MDKIKMIATDLDGTLLNSKSEISVETKQCLIKAQEEGICLVLASGRSHLSLINYGQQLKVDEYNGYYIGANGATLTNANTLEHKIISQLKKEEIKNLFNDAKLFNVEILGVVDDTIFDYIPSELKEIKKEYRIKNNISDDTPWTAGNFKIIHDQRKNNYTNIIYIENYDEINQPINKLCFADEEKNLTELYNLLIEKYGDKYHFALTSPTWIETTHLGINKGDALLGLAKSLGIKKEEIVAFGDGENDLSMIKLVKYGVAMSNAMDSVKKAAYAITDDNDSNGIAKYLEKNKIVQEVNNE